MVGEHGREQGDEGCLVFRCVGVFEVIVLRHIEVRSLEPGATDVMIYSCTVEGMDE